MHKVLLEVRGLPDLILELKYDNGEIVLIDFKQVDLFNLSAALKDQKYFEQVQLVDCAPTWPNGFDLDPDELYELEQPLRVAAST